MNDQHQTFEELKQFSSEGSGFWSARDLTHLVEYKDWRNFQNVISKAMQACEASEHALSDHFVESTKMLVLGSGSQRELEDIIEVGQKVRQTIAELGGTMPENLPTPEKSIKQLESAVKKLANRTEEE